MRQTLRSQWICAVVRSGYHNGAACAPEEPHLYWGCGYYFSLMFQAPGPNASVTIETQEATE